MATIHDVARDSGVSLATVSFVLNNGPRPVSARTRQRVLEVMERLNYQPSGVARGLARRRMHTIGVLFSGHNPRIVHNPYAVALLDGIVSAATTHRYNVTLISRQANNTQEAASFVCDGRVDGVLLMSPLAGADAALGLSARGTPLLQIGAPSVLPDTPWVDIDNPLGARLAARHLLDLGHRRIGLFLGRAEYEHVRQRRDAFLAELSAAGVAPPAHHRLESETYGDEVGRGPALFRLLSRADRPTAILASSDPLALQALQTAQQFGLLVPEQLSIIGFDDIPDAGHDGPKLTTIRQPLFEMGEAAAGRLIARIEGNREPDADSAQPMVFPPELLIRGSTGPPPIS